MTLPKVGFTPESPQNFIVDSGVIVRDLTYDKSTGFTGTPIGATSGGTKVEIEIKKRLMEVDGAYITPVKGLEVVESFTAKMSSKLKEFSPETIALISGGTARAATEDEAPDGYQVIEFERQVKDGDYIDSIAIYGFQRGTNKEIIVVLDNCLVTSTFGLDTKDKDEATSDLEFTAHATPEQMLVGEMPCRIFYPSTASIIATGITLNKTTLSLAAGATETLIATVAPENATNKTVTFTSSDPLVATVDNQGKITAIKAGTATITATTANGKTATLALTVTTA